MNQYKLDFYYYDACPFCQYVKSTISELKIKVSYMDIWEDDKHLKKLLNDTGRRTVPCLYINDKPMLESGDIIDWLRNNENKLEKN